MRIKAPRHRSRLTVQVLFIAGLSVVSGCSGQQASTQGDAEKLAQRAQRVAAAWDGTSAAAKWRAGYHPMGDVVQPPHGGLHSKADEQAFRNRKFTLQGKLPDKSPKNGQVTWSGGRSLARPLVGAYESYKSLAGTAAEQQPYLGVTGARLGKMTVATARGLATVPAWLYTLDGYDSPLKRAAVVPSELPTPPIGRTSSVPGTSLHHLIRISADGRSTTVAAQHGTCDDVTVKALETPGSVVLSAAVRKREKDAHCPKQAKLQRVTVKLNHPLGRRVLLDAVTGRPVPFRGPAGPSPSWS